MTTGTARSGLAIDLHHHSVPAGLVRRVRAEGERHGIRVGPADRLDREVLALPSGQECVLHPEATDLEFRDLAMAAARLDIAAASIRPLVLSSFLTDRAAAEWYSRAANDGIAEDIEASSRRLVGFADLPLQHPELAAAELRRLMTDAPFIGAQIPSHVGPNNLDDPALDPFWEAAEEMRAVLFIHPTQSSEHLRLERYFLFNLIGNPLETSIAVASLLFGGVRRRFPGLRFVLAHSGGFVPWIYPRWEHGARESKLVPNLEEPMSVLLRWFHYDTLIYEPAPLRYLVSTVGADRVVVGTDYPADMGNARPHEQLARVPGLGDDEVGAVLGDNALALISSSRGCVAHEMERNAHA